MFGSVTSVALVGASPRPVRVEARLSEAAGQAQFSLVGLPDTAVREAKERVRAAMAASGYPFPMRRVVVNLSPADLPKAGTAYDLPIALALLSAAGYVRPHASGLVCLGELALDGAVRPVPAALGAAVVARATGRRCVIPIGSGSRSWPLEHVDVQAVPDLATAAAVAAGESPDHEDTRAESGVPVHADLSEVRRMAAAKRGLEVAAPGGHHMLFTGPPGGHHMLFTGPPGGHHMLFTGPPGGHHMLFTGPPGGHHMLFTGPPGGHHMLFTGPPGGHHMLFTGPPGGHHMLFTGPPGGHHMLFTGPPGGHHMLFTGPPGGHHMLFTGPPGGHHMLFTGPPGGHHMLFTGPPGGHHMLFTGPPGGGKTMLARCLAGLLPPLRAESSVEVALAWAAAGRGRTLSEHVPFRAPHHSASVPAMVGGGSGTPVPGEITLAHEGVLFLDELGEFPPRLLDCLRQPLEDGEFVVARKGASVRFPCRFQLIAATNPCPCGYLGDNLVACSCSQASLERYGRRLSGPLADRIDLRITVPRVDPGELQGSPAEPSQAVRSRVWKPARGSMRGAGSTATFREPTSIPCRGKRVPSATYGRR